MRIILLSSVLGLALTCGGNAFAGIEILSESTHAGGGAPTAHTIYVAPDRLKVETDRVEIIYRGDTNTITNVMKEKHEYMVMDADSVAKMNTRMAEMHAKLEQQMAAMPEAQRQQMEAMMAKNGVPAAGPAKLAPLVKTGQTKTVGSWSCQVFRRTLSETARADLCMAPASAIGFNANDLAAFRALTGKMRKLMPDTPGMTAFGDFDTQTKEIGFEGLPVETVTYRDGKPTSTTTMKSIRHVTLTDDQFEVPAGYTKQDFPNGAR